MKQKIDIDWLFFFRVSTGLFAILSLLAFWADVPKILYEGAYIKPELLDVLADEFSPTIYGIHQNIIEYFPNLGFDALVRSFIYLYILASLLIVVGLFTRTAAFVALLLQIIIYKSMHLYLYGADFFLTMILFYCIIFPKSKLSLDYRFFKFKQNQISLKWSLILLQTHVCIIYFFSGLDKALGITWWNGEAIWKAVNSHNYNGIIDLFKIELPNIIYVIVGIATVAVELLYPIFINIKATRKLWLYLTISMHLSIAVFMGLYFFAMIMSILNLAAFYFPNRKQERESLKIHSIPDHI